MKRRSHFTYASVTVMQALAHGYRFGFDIMDATGLPSGTVYPALRRLERQRFVTARWEKEALARREGRPARRYYELTANGVAALADALDKYHLVKALVPKPAEG
jgi:DNA-binding PadR family transcriptional regulator